ncbi:MAG: hypothetical protein AAB444_03155 [Patescibacteria group bacterium]
MMFRKLFIFRHGFAGHALFIAISGFFLFASSAGAQMKCPPDAPYNVVCGLCGVCPSPGAVILGPDTPQVLTVDKPLIDIQRNGSISDLIRINHNGANAFVVDAENRTNIGGQIIVGSASDPIGLTSAQNLLYGLLDSAAQGNALMFQKKISADPSTPPQTLFTLNNVGNAVFGGSVTAPSLSSATATVGEMCLSNVCKSAWPTVEAVGGDATLLQFNNGSGGFGGTAGMYWDAVNQRLRMGVAPDAYPSKAKMYIYNNSAEANGAPALVLDGARDATDVNYHGIEFRTQGTPRASIIQEATGNLYVRSTKNLILNDSSTGSVGIGTSAPTGGTKLDVVGSVRIADTTEGVNKVLTSNANGLATWQAPLWSNLSGFPAACTGGEFVTGVSSGTLTFTCASPPSGGSSPSQWETSISGNDIFYTTGQVGKVGIGTNVPLATLHIKGQGSTTATGSLLVENSAGMDTFIIDDAGRGLLVGPLVAPRIIDSTDPAYYVDPSGNSVVSTIQATAIEAVNGVVKAGTIETGSLLDLQSTSSTPGASGYFGIDPSGNSFVNNLTAGTFGANSILASTTVNAPTVLATNVNTTNVNAAAVIATSALTAPLFYDKDNTNYYVNPATLSVLNSLTLSNLLTGTTLWLYGSTTTNKMLDTDDTAYYVDPSGGSRLKNLTVDNLLTATTLALPGTITTSKMLDYNDSTYFLDPNDNSRLKDLTVDNLLTATTLALPGTITTSKMLDYNDSTYFLDPSNSTDSMKVAGRVKMEETADATLTGGGGLVIGNTATGIDNMIFDGNEIMARNSGAASTLYLNNDGGAVHAGGEELVNATGGLRTNTLDPADFDSENVKGALILGVNSTQITCWGICNARGLNCSWDSSGSGENGCTGGSVARRYCWCE